MHTAPWATCSPRRRSSARTPIPPTSCTPAAAPGHRPGLLAGLLALDHPARVVGIDVDAQPKRVAADIGRVGRETAALLGLEHRWNDDKIEVAAAFSAGAYGIADATTEEAIRLAARTEALALDPVYAGKGMAGLIGLARQGRFDPDETIVWIHTAGLPGIFAYPDTMARVWVTGRGITTWTCPPASATLPSRNEETRKVRDTQIQIEPLTSFVGAEIHGVDLREPLTDNVLGTIRDTFGQYGVVFFRNQPLTPEQHIAFAERFGPININRCFTPVPGYPSIAEVRKEPHNKDNIGGGWHTDHSYDRIPAIGSALYAREVPNTGGDTLFASMYAAHDALSDGLKATLETLRACHSSRHGLRRGWPYRPARSPGPRRQSGTRDTGRGSPRRDPPSAHWAQSALRQSRLHPEL